MQPPIFTPVTANTIRDGTVRHAAAEPNGARSSLGPPSTDSEKMAQDNREPSRCGDPFKHPLRKQKDPWEDCNDMVRKYDQAMCNGWKDEITNLLIFAGLFSAVVTTFTIESYKWLQSNSVDTSLAVLVHISSQLSASPSNVTARAPVSIPAFSAPTWAVQINAFWFLSLTLSLTTAIVGILCLQWLREYERDAYVSAKDSLALRHMLHEGLQKWQVPKILYALPLILQLALVLFFAGLLILLWTLNHTVAGVAGVFVGLTLLFIIVTTILPTFQFLFPLDKDLKIPQCPYKSLQSWAFFRTIGAISWLLTVGIVPFTARERQNSDSLEAAGTSAPPNHNPLNRVVTRSFNAISDLYLALSKFEKNMWKLSDWGQFDHYWISVRNVPKKESQHYDTIRGLQWVNKKLPQIDATYIIHPCLLDLEVPSAIHAISVLSHSHSATRDKDANDSLHWFSEFYQQTDNHEKHFRRSTRPKAESNPLHREMVSLLGIRHLNVGPFLHPEIRNHYLELYTRIRHTGGENVAAFFQRPLGLPSPRNTHPESSYHLVSEQNYLEKMFELLNTHVPEDTVLQLLMILLPHIRGWQHTAVAPSISFIGEIQLTKNMDHIITRWKLMQPVWNILCRILKGPLPFVDEDSKLRAHILAWSFALGDEMKEYAKLLWRGRERRQLECVLEGMFLLQESLGAQQFLLVKKLRGYHSIAYLALTMTEFINEDPAMSWSKLDQGKPWLRIVEECCKGFGKEAASRQNGTASSEIEIVDRVIE